MITLLKDLGDNWLDNIFLLLTGKPRNGVKLHHGAQHKKNIECEIRCLLLLPTSTSLLLFYLDYLMLRWCMCDYWLIFNENQVEEKLQRNTWPLLSMCNDFSMTALAVDTTQGLSKCIHSNSFPWYHLISQKLLCKWRDRFVHWRCNWSVTKVKCAISINTIGNVSKDLVFVTNAAFEFCAERPVRKICDSLPTNHPQLKAVT